jgi:N-acyl amino acid synthase of PEP-CTERM/exosortase system
MTQTMSSLSIDLKDFATHFRGCEVKPSRHEVLMQQALALRYDVYCRECRFLRAEDYPDQQESDEYDAQSAHFASFARDQNLAGCVPARVKVVVA